MKWTKDQKPKDGERSDRLSIKYNGKPQTLIFLEDRWNFYGGRKGVHYKVQDYEWKDIEWLDESENETASPLLIEANDVLRSCHAVVERKGKDTNWEPLERLVSNILKKQHKVMYPQFYLEKAADESINQEGSLKDSDWKEKFREWDEGRCKFETYRDTETLVDWIEENVIAPLLQNECKGDDLVAEASANEGAAEATLRSTVETQIEQDKKH